MTILQNRPGRRTPCRVHLSVVILIITALYLLNLARANETIYKGIVLLNLLATLGRVRG
jgi:hypothetical protein